MISKEELEKEIARLRPIIRRNGFAFTRFMFPGIIELYNKRAQQDEEGKTHYQRQKENRPSRQHNIELTNYFYHQILKDLIKGMEVKYLDVGCGDGLRTKEFIQELSTYCYPTRTKAVDISSGMVKAAELILGRENVLVGDICALSYENEFDLITCMYGTIAHLPEHLIDTALKNLSTALKNGGHLCIDVEGMNQTLFEMWGYTEEDGKYFAYYVSDGTNNILDDDGKPAICTARFFTPKDMQDFVTRAGFKIIAEKQVNPTDPRKDFGMEYAMVLQT